MKKATINDVARKCGLSVKTVSRVINSSPNVKQETKDKVEKAIAETGYQVNLLAKGLKGNRTNIVVVFADRSKEDPLTAWHDVMLKYLFAYAQEKKLKIMFSLSNSEQFETDETDGFYLIANGLADGAILLENINNDSRIAYFERMKIPYVLFGEANVDTLPSVSMDNFDAGYSGGKYLLEKGYRDIVFLIGERKFRSTQLRIEGFEQAVKHKDCEYEVCSEVNTVEKAYKKAYEILDKRKARAFFTSGDERALGVYRAIYEKSLRIPEDVSVLGIDNIPNGRFYYPPISTVAQDFEAMAHKCIDYLIEQIEYGFDNIKRKKIAYPAKIIERKST